jgi:hypothetical protein
MPKVKGIIKFKKSQSKSKTSDLVGKGLIIGNKSNLMTLTKFQIPNKKHDLQSKLRSGTPDAASH